jgi:hypothetical protein
MELVELRPREEVENPAIGSTQDPDGEALKATGIKKKGRRLSPYPPLVAHRYLFLPLQQ